MKGMMVANGLQMASEPSFFENIITALAGVIGIYALFCPGTKGNNQYGEDPLE